MEIQEKEIIFLKFFLFKNSQLFFLCIQIGMCVNVK